MAIERVQPDPEYADLNLHQFRCEICNKTEFLRFKKESLNTRWRVPWTSIQLDRQ
jgi:hypothetical protein